MAKKVQKKATKPQTVKEFKAWLEGITEFQPVDWCPTTEQWDTIKEKISNLQEEIIVKESVSTVQPVSNKAIIEPSRVNNLNLPPAQVPQNIDELPIVRQPPAGMSAIKLLPVGDEDPGELLVPEVPQPIIQTVASSIAAPPNSNFTGKQYKTPHIDSSQGYKSGFI